MGSMIEGGRVALEGVDMPDLPDEGDVKNAANTKVPRSDGGR